MLTTIIWTKRGIRMMPECVSIPLVFGGGVGQDGGWGGWVGGGQHDTVDLACSGDGVDDDDDEDANDLGKDAEDDAAVIERDSIRR